MAAIQIDRSEVQVLSDEEINLMLSEALHATHFTPYSASTRLSMVQSSNQSYRNYIRMIALSVIVVLGVTLGVSFVKSSAAHAQSQSGSAVHYNRNGVLIISPVTAVQP